jgi:hypothetical protein
VSELRFRGAGARVDLVASDLLPSGVRDLVLDVLAPLKVAVDSVSADGVVDVTEVGQDVLVDGTALPADVDKAAAVVVGAVDRRLLGTTRCLCLHAAVLGGERGAAIAPAASGAGKSTLVAAGLQAGLRLVSDEAACLDPVDDVLWPHPRPLGLDGNSRRLLGLPTPAHGPPDSERATAPALLGLTAPVARPVPAAVVVVLERTSSEIPGAVVTSLSRGQGCAVLLANCLNIGPGRPWAPEAAWARLTALVQTLDVVRLRYDRPQEAAAALAELLA